MPGIEQGPAISDLHKIFEWGLCSCIAKALFEDGFRRNWRVKNSL